MRVEDQVWIPAGGNILGAEWISQKVQEGKPMLPLFTSTSTYAEALARMDPDFQGYVKASLKGGEGEGDRRDAAAKEE